MDLLVLEAIAYKTGLMARLQPDTPGPNLRVALELIHCWRAIFWGATIAKPTISKITMSATERRKISRVVGQSLVCQPSQTGLSHLAQQERVA
ncbi:hypothetical protein [Phormidesmis sp. 146-33]